MSTPDNCGLFLKLWDQAPEWFLFFLQIIRKFIESWIERWKFFAGVFCTKWTHMGMWLGDRKKFSPDFDGFGFLLHSECAVNKKKFEARPKLKVGGECFWAHMYAYNAFFEKNLSFGSFVNV